MLLSLRGGGGPKTPELQALKYHPGDTSPAVFQLALFLKRTCGETLYLILRCLSSWLPKSFSPPPTPGNSQKLRAMYLKSIK